MGVGAGPLLRFFIIKRKQVASRMVEDTKSIVLIQDIAENVCKKYGVELYDVEINSYSAKQVLRVFIDCEAGINVDDCANVSRDLSELLDANNIFEGHYILEVSSPGVDRKLLKSVDFRRHLEYDVKIKLLTPIDKHSKLQGKLVEISEDETSVVVEIKGKKMEITRENISECRVVPDFKNTSGRAMS
jgi:ribosome maturation factor RimP